MTKTTPIKDDFLPANFNEAQVPKDEKYMKLKEDGEYRFRFLSSPIVGIECWKDGKPVRFRTLAEMPVNAVWDEDPFKKGQTKKPKTFWSAIVWNYRFGKDEAGNDVGKMQILNLTQPSIIDAIRENIEDPEWGNPKYYDLKIKREKKDGKVEYTVRAVIPSELDPLIVGEYGMCNWKLEALFDGKDPFSE